jgi:GT2 family glycosyltransferase
VNLAVVTLGTPARLWSCLAALREHESHHPFTVGVVVNADTVDGSVREAAFPDDVAVAKVATNLGWPGGLHAARALTDAELFVWVQDDMVPEPGWLDALVDAADAHPGAGALGSVRVDATGRVVLHNAGPATPHDAVERWNDADTTPETLPAGVTAYDWVTSKGLLTRSAVFDEVHGPDPRLWPLNHVDKEFCTHLRAHGWDVALVPDARLQHAGSQSAPTPFRAFLAHWREPWLNERWSGVVAALAQRPPGSREPVEHPCADWMADGSVAEVVGAEAARMVVPLSRTLAHEASEHEGMRLGMLADLQAHADRIEAALAAATDERDRAVRRARRLRRRLRQQRNQPPQQSRRGWGRLSRAVVRRVRSLRDRLR